MSFRRSINHTTRATYVISPVGRNDKRGIDKRLKRIYINMDSVTFWKIIVQSLMAITVGVLILRYAKKLPESKLFSIKFKGYAAGVAFILLGIIHLLNEFHLW